MRFLKSQLANYTATQVVDYPGQAHKWTDTDVISSYKENIYESYVGVIGYQGPAESSISKRPTFKFKKEFKENERLLFLIFFVYLKEDLEKEKGRRNGEREQKKEQEEEGEIEQEEWSKKVK
ncbi:unnamed protein product [Rhizophagus irregularis]|nr:unnamed protein product [Rhizophagus irregularis]CAB5363582.1 unnamed protein product [Rhizophagus irregularis]